jgi:type I restriction enzyme M protein
MRKSLGAKRKEISADQIQDVTRLYAGFTEGELVKIFPNSAFGVQRITVERPLRLRYTVMDETLPALKETKVWAKLDRGQRDELEAHLVDLQGFSTVDRRAMVRKLGDLPKGVDKAIWDAVSVPDPEAPVVTGRKGAREPDPDLRDNENVPLPEGGDSWAADPTERLETPRYRAAVDEYMTAEVLPYVPEAWVDHSKTRIGFEIPLTRHFYKYVPPRPLAEIDAEISNLEAEIEHLLAELTD